MNTRGTTLSGFKVPQRGQQSLFCSVSARHSFIYTHKSDGDLISIIPLYKRTSHNRINIFRLIIVNYYANSNYPPGKFS